MNSNINLCESSHHTSKVNLSWPAGLSTYFFRLQTHGRASLTLDDRHYTLKSGDLLLIEPGTPFTLQVRPANSKRYTVISSDFYLMCRGGWLDAWWKLAERDTVQSIQHVDKLLYYWQELINEKRNIYDQNTEYSEYLLRLLCMTMDKASSFSKTSVNSRSQAAAVMRRYIEEHATGHITLADVAKNAGFSVSRSSRIFKSAYGKTIIQYTMEVRMETAVNLIKYSPLTLEQIAEASGFGSYTYFHRVFSREWGQPPSVFAKHHRQHG